MIKIRKIATLLLIVTFSFGLLSCGNTQMNEVEDVQRAEVLLKDLEQQMQSGMEVKIENGDYLHSVLEMEGIVVEEDTKTSLTSEVKTVYRFSETNSNEDVYYKSDSVTIINMKSASINMETTVEMSQHIIGNTYYVQEFGIAGSNKLTGEVNYLQTPSEKDFTNTALETINQINMSLFDELINNKTTVEMLEYITIYEKGNEFMYEFNMDISNLEEILPYYIAIANTNVNLNLNITISDKEITEITLKLVTTDDSSENYINLSYHMYIKNSDTINEDLSYDDYKAGEPRTLMEILVPIEEDIIV